MSEQMNENLVLINPADLEAYISPIQPFPFTRHQPSCPLWTAVPQMFTVLTPLHPPSSYLHIQNHSSYIFTLYPFPCPLPIVFWGMPRCPEQYNILWRSIISPPLCLPSPLQSPYNHVPRGTPNCRKTCTAT